MGDVKQVHSQSTLEVLKAYDRGRRDAFRCALADLEMILDNEDVHGAGRKNLEQLARDIRACLREIG